MRTHTTLKQRQRHAFIPAWDNVPDTGLESPVDPQTGMSALPNLATVAPLATLVFGLDPPCQSAQTISRQVRILLAKPTFKRKIPT